jgi:NADPH:quinone reductase-like Zn-dependent oxidoreductase
MPRIVRFMQTGGPEVLQIDKLEVPAPGPDEVQIRAKALGLNRAESMWRRGEYIEDPILPARLGYEVAGTIEAIGEGVSGFAIGDAVSVIPAFSQNQYGMYGELALAPAFAVVKHPPSLSFEEAASVWMMFVTAYGALVTQAKLGTGETIVIPAASSSVGLAAIQVAKMLGAVPVASTRTNGKREQLLQAGADHVIATEEHDITAEILKLTDGKGARVVFDPVGGPTFAKLHAAVSFGGILILYGDLSDEPTVIPLLSSDPVQLQAAIAFVVDGLAKGLLKPVIARVSPFEEIVEAHRYLKTNRQFGKIVVTF